MKKTITISGIDVELNNNIGWTFEYRDQFGHDIIPTLMPLLAAAIDLIKDVIEVSSDEGISPEDLMKLTDNEGFLNALIHISGFEAVELVNIVWALAKCANDDIPEPKRWVRQFDTFPIDEILPEVFNLVTMGVISSKNSERLKNLKSKIIQPESI